jgi:hypothetical protein
MKIIKSIEQFKKVFEDDNQVQTTSSSPNDGSSENVQKKIEQGQNAKQTQSPPQKKSYFYNGKKIEGVVKDGKIVSKAGNLKLDDVKEIGMEIKKIEELKPYFYYIQNLDNINYRFVKVVGVKDGMVKIVFQKNNLEEELEIDFKKIKLIKTNPEKQDEKGFAQSKKKTQEEKDKEVSSDKITDKISEIEKMEDLPKEEINKVLKAGENDKETKVKIVDKDGKEKEMSLADAIKKLKYDMEPKSSNERINYNKSYSKIFEADDVIVYDSVKNIWRGFFEEYDKKEKINLSQREVDEIDKLMSSGKNTFSLNVSKKPDPIVSITKVFSRAHELYFTDIIPSGRPKGRISVKTAREYIQLGKQSYRIDPDDPVKHGPYAVKSVFNQWRNGVLTILQDQSYIKILSKVDFVVPGAQDRFNPEDTTKKKVNDSKKYNISSNYVINERDDIPLKRGESSGQILFEYMTEMLNPKKLDDFETLQSELLNKYFGIDRKQAEVGEIKPTTTGKGKSIKEADEDPHNLLWWGFENESKFKKYIGDNDFGKGHILLLSFKYSGTNYLMVAEIEDGKNVNKELEFNNVNLVDVTDNSQIIKDIKANTLNYKLENFVPLDQTKPIQGNHKGNLKFDSNSNKWILELNVNPFKSGQEIKFIKTMPK